MMNSKSSCFVDFMIVCLIGIYIGAYFMPEHYGIRCTEGHSPQATMVLGLFYMIWTAFTVKTIRNDPMLELKD